MLYVKEELKPKQSSQFWEQWGNVKLLSLYHYPERQRGDLVQPLADLRQTLLSSKVDISHWPYVTSHISLDSPVEGT